MIRIALALLIYASLVSAQTWEWEQFQGMFWHQAPDGIPWVEAGDTFPPHNVTIVSADFNGNGRDELLWFNNEMYALWETVAASDILVWDYATQYEEFAQSDELFVFAQALNLDSDPQVELLVYTTRNDGQSTNITRCFDPDTFLAPHFTERPDLIESLAFPGFPSPSMLGNFDGDTLLDGIVVTSTGLEYYERVNSSWILRETFDVQPYSDFPFYCG